VASGSGTGPAAEKKSLHATERDNEENRRRREVFLDRLRSIAPEQLTIEAATDAEIFLAYLDHVLCPALRPGDVVVMDNLSSHKVAGVRDRIAATGVELLYLPPYSPDLNPIERAWAKLTSAPHRPSQNRRGPATSDRTTSTSYQPTTRSSLVQNTLPCSIAKRSTL
jgi:DDE superfamily endonuclease